MSNKWLMFRCPFHTVMYSIATISAASIAYSQFLSYRKRKHLNIPPELNGTTAFDRELKEALIVALQAGENLQKALNLPKDITQKGEVDFVTATDKLNEKIIFDHLKAVFPDHDFIGEESSSDNKCISPLTDKATWIVDPIDGTTNFMHTFPLTCVSIGMCMGGDPVLGVVVVPALGEVYMGVKGHGAYLNGKRIRVSGAKRIQDSLLLTELGYIRDASQRRRFTDCIQAVLNETPHALRMMGCGVLSLCYVACGRLDALYCGVAGEGWMPWDYCAGVLLVREAGGSVGALGGEEFSVMSRSCVAAASDELCSQLQKVVDLEMKKITATLN